MTNLRRGRTPPSQVIRMLSSRLMNIRVRKVMKRIGIRGDDTKNRDGGFNRSGETEIPGEDCPVISEEMLTVRLVLSDE